MSYYPKRRAKPGPSKNEQKVQRGREASERDGRTGALRTHYPNVEGIVVRLEFLSPQQAALGAETRQFRSGDPLNLSVPCPGRCGGGAFDLAGKIRAMVEAGETKSEARGVCPEKLYGDTGDTCGTQLKCVVEVRFVPQAA